MTPKLEVTSGPPPSREVASDPNQKSQVTGLSSGAAVVLLRCGSGPVSGPVSGPSLWSGQWSGR